MPQSLEGQFTQVLARLQHPRHDPSPPASDIALCVDFARAAMHAVRPDLAVAVLEPLSLAVAGTAKVWAELGLAYRDEQRMGDASRALARAAALAPEDPSIAFDHAQTCFASGLPAAQFFRHVRQLAPDHLGATRQAAAALEAEGERAEAEEILMHALARHPDWLEGHESLAAMRFTSGQSGFARSYAAAVRLQPRNAALRLAWFYTLARLRDWAGAARILDQGESLIGPATAFTLARLYIASESGEHERAQILFEQTESIQDAGLDICRIRHCLRTGQWANAEAAGLRLSQSPSGRLSWPYLSLIWRLRGSRRAEWLDGSPPYIKVYDLEFSTGELHELAALLRGLHTARAPHIEQSVRGGTQTDSPLFFRQEPIIQTTKSRIIEAIGAYIAALPACDATHPLLGTDRRRIFFEGSWSVRLQAQGFHVSHTHPKGWISSAFYVAMPDVDCMGTPPAGWIGFGTPPAELGLDLAPYAQIEPKAGRLVLFPSTMWHSTVPFGDGERLVIAFDVRARKLQDVATVG